MKYKGYGFPPGNGGGMCFNGDRDKSGGTNYGQVVAFLYLGEVGEDIFFSFLITELCR